jgi:hypothetical protein
MLKVNVHTENAAFEGENLQSEAARILRAIAGKIENGHDGSHYQTILDINGNDVGRWKLSEEES